MPSLVKAISKIFGGGSKKSKTADGNHYPDTPSFSIDAKKIEKEKKKAQKNASTKKRGKDTATGTSYSSGPHSAEIRIPGKLYLPVSDKNSNTLQQRTNNGNSNNNGQYSKKTNDDNIYLGQIVTIPLSENHHKLNSPMNSGTTGKVKQNFHLHHSTTSAAANTNSLPARHTSTLPPGPNSRSQRYFSDDDDSENQGGVVTTNLKKNATTTHNHPYSSSTFDHHPQFDNDNGFSLSASPNLAAYLGTPTSSSDFCLSSDVEDEEYNRVKHRYSAGLLRPIAYSTSTEDESALFPALEGKGTGSVTSPAGSDGMMAEGVEKPSPQAATDILRVQQQRPSSVGQVLTVSGPLHKQQQQPQQQQQQQHYHHHTKAIAIDGEDLFSPSNLRSPQQPSRTTSTTPSMPTNSRFFPSQLLSPVPRSSSKVNAHSDAFGFDEFVVNDWPPTIAAEHAVVAAPPANNNTQVVAQRRANSNKNIISFDGGDLGNNSPSLPNVFAASDASAGMKHSKNRSGDSVASAPLDELMAASRPSLNRVVASPPGRGSRSVAVPSRPSPSSYRSQLGGSTTRSANAQLLDKLERDLRDRNLGGTTTNSSSSHRNASSMFSTSSKGVSSATSTNTTKRTQRSTNQTSDLDLFRRGDPSAQNPDQWLMEEVSETLGPRGVAADLESLSGKSARSKTDRSTGGKSHRSHKSRSNKKNLSSSGNSVTSRTSNFSTHSYMSEASRSVANDLLRLEMQLAMVGNDRAASGNGTSSSSIVESAPITTTTTGTLSVGGGNGTNTSYRSKRGTSARHNRSSPSSSSRKTVVAPPGKLGLILANKSDGRGTVVSGVRAGSALAESIAIGDRIIAVDGEDVSYMNVAELTTIMSRKSDFHRKLSVLSFSRSLAPSPVSRSRDIGALS